MSPLAHRATSFLSILSWRRERDSNPRTNLIVHSLSRRCPYQTWVSLHNSIRCERCQLGFSIGLYRSYSGRCWLPHMPFALARFCYLWCAELDSNQRCILRAGFTVRCHQIHSAHLRMAEAVGFEPTRDYSLLVFKTSAISQTRPHFQKY